jgi:hypothetical protein
MQEKGGHEFRIIHRGGSDKAMREAEQDKVSGFVGKLPCNPLIAFAHNDPCVGKMPVDFIEFFRCFGRPGRTRTYDQSVMSALL